MSLSIWGLRTKDNDRSRNDRSSISNLKGAWPWAAVLGQPRKDGSFYIVCTGSLISPRSVLTAAHCVVSSLTHVRLGDHNISSKADGAKHVDFEVEQFLVHPEYDEASIKGDVAILRLAKPVTAFDRLKSGISTVCLPDAFVGEDLVGRDAVVIGWGAESTEGPPSSVLRQVQFSLECRGSQLDEKSISGHCKHRVADSVCAGVQEGREHQGVSHRSAQRPASAA